jgi:hypothetical protein
MDASTSIDRTGVVIAGFSAGVEEKEEKNTQLRRQRWSAKP